VSDRGHQRHLARARALEIYYEASAKDRPLDQVTSELPLVPDAYTLTLLAAVRAHEDASLELIARHAIDWPLERMALVDRLIMTLALSELAMDEAPSVAIVLDEAVELAKTFSTEDSPGFVNGVLSAAVRDLTERGTSTTVPTEINDEE